MKETISLNFYNHSKFLFIIFISTMILSCNSGSENRSTYRIKEMFIFLADSVTTPKLNQFKQSITDLNNSIGTLDVNSTKTEFNLVKTHWESATLAWKFIETGYVGYLSESFLRNKIYNLTEKNKIDELLNSSYKVDSKEFLQIVTSKNRGLLSLDYLLYRDNAYNQFITSQRDRDVIQKITALLYENSIQLYNAYQVQHNNIHFISKSGSRYNTEQAAVNEYINAFVLQLEDYRDMTITKLLGLNTGEEVSPEVVEARFSGLSKKTLSEGIRGFQMFFNGNEFYGFDDLLYERGSEYGTDLNNELDKLKDLIQALPEDFSSDSASHKDKFQLVHDQLTFVLRKVKTDIASFLSVTIGLSDNDGD